MWVPVNTWGTNLCLGGRGSYETVHDAVEALYADYRQDRGDLWLLQTVLTFGRVEKPEGPGLTQTVWAPAQGFEGRPFGDLGYLGRVETTRPGQFCALGETPPAVPYRSGVEAASLEAVCCDLLRLRQLRDAGRWAAPSGWTPPDYTYQPADVLDAPGFDVSDSDRNVGYGWEGGGEWEAFGYSRQLGWGACQFSATSRTALSHALSLYTHYEEWVQTTGLAAPLREKHHWEDRDYYTVFHQDTLVGTLTMDPVSVTVETANGRRWSLTNHGGDESVRNPHALQQLAAHHGRVDIAA